MKTPKPPDTSFTIGRIAVCAEPGDTEGGEQWLLQILDDLCPNDVHVQFLITPGGFVKAFMPEEWTGGAGWQSKPYDLDLLRAAADDALEHTLTPAVLKAAAGKVDFVTIGVDLIGHTRLHAELVGVREIATGRTWWTGKSYPTPSQERYLVQVTNLESHFLEVGGERVLVLGCHDLNMWNPRGRANQAPGGVRWNRCEQMRRLTRDFNPTVVLHHPHSTDTPNIWRLPWGEINREFPALKAYASGIGYFEGFRGELQDVLDATTSPSGVVDFILLPPE